MINGTHEVKIKKRLSPNRWNLHLQIWRFQTKYESVHNALPIILDDLECIDIIG